MRPHNRRSHRLREERSQPRPGLGAGSNYGDGFEPGYGEVDYDPEPSGNNCRYHNFQIAEPGSFFLRYGGNDRLDLGYDDELWPCAGDPDQGIVPRQTQCDSGDGPVAGGQNYYIEVAGRNQEGVLPVKDQWLCGVLDNSIATIRRQIIVALARSLLRCPCCARPNVHLHSDL